MNEALCPRQSLEDAIKMKSGEYTGTRNDEERKDLPGLSINTLTRPANEEEGMFHREAPR